MLTGQRYAELAQEPSQPAPSRARSLLCEQPQPRYQRSHRMVYMHTHRPTKTKTMANKKKTSETEHKKNRNRHGLPTRTCAILSAALRSACRCRSKRSSSLAAQSAAASWSESPPCTVH
jgi:hypothetical protein